MECKRCAQLEKELAFYKTSSEQSREIFEAEGFDIECEEYDEALAEHLKTLK